MKKFARSTLLCFIPIVIGVVCFIVGNTIGNSTVTYVGMLSIVAGLPAMMVIFLIVGLILMSMGKLGGETSAADNKTAAADETQTDDAETTTPLQSEHEQEIIEAVNSTHGFASRANMAEYEMDSITEGMKHAPKWGIAVGLSFFFSLVALLIAATVLLINRIFVGAIVCAAIVGITLITTFIVMSVRRAKATNGDISRAQKITEGKVKACFMVGTTTTKSGGLRHGNGETVRIQSVTYKVIVIADGEEYGTFSKRYYEADETVTIAVMGKKRAKIVEDVETEKIKSE